MKKFKVSLIKEFTELSFKLDKLFNFIQSTRFIELSEENQKLLLLQKKAMEEYKDILIMRIDLF